MTKQEAVRLFVERDLSSVPRDWVKIVSESEGDFNSLPMWGTMWIVDRHVGEQLMARSRILVSEPYELVRENVDSDEEWERVQEAIKSDDWNTLSEYVDEEMAGEHCVLDSDSNTTRIYVYDIAGEYVIGVDGAGFNFYDHVWPSLYDTLGLRWHDEASEPEA